jgi:uncharacterized cupredoxin-like copper-binding protein
MHKRLLALLSIVMVVMLVLGACGDDDDDDDDDSGAATPAATGGGGEGGGTAVAMRDTMEFDPSSLTVTAGEEVSVDLTNEGAIEHNFSVDDADVDQTLNGGESESFTFTAPSDPGEYEIYCNVPGHREAGMVATLIVEE